MPGPLTTAIDAPRIERARRFAAAAIAFAGALDLGSAVTPPLRDRLQLVLHVVPLAVSQTAAALVALAGLALLALARGVRRGQRQAWTISVALLGGTALLHIVKGVELGGAAVALGICMFLLLERDAFGTAIDRPSRRLGTLGLAGGVVAATFVTTLATEVFLLFDRDAGVPSLPRVFLAVTERLVGVHTIALPRRLDEFLSPSLLAIGLALAAFALALVSRPVVDRRRQASAPSLTRARAIVARYGSGTLDYFALRDDKQHFFHGETLVTYAVYGGVCLVSPDPIGPERERSRAWAAFRAFADGHGWIVAVLGAGADRLATYGATGMRELYVGDEALVDVHAFSLAGGRNKSLRQAVNRVARHGYTVSFHDPTDLAPELADALRAVMTKSRRGGAERGFSMTLGRVFDPADTDLLLAVAHDPAGTPVAFCQFVPAPGIAGYSLDLMRRDLGEHPNGLLDFAIVSTIEHLRGLGMATLGLNFATMRAVLAGEAGDSLPQRLERWVIRRMSGGLQIESLWRFNAKYDPTWLARYVVYSVPEDLVPIAMAIARAESFWELPVIGRFLSGDRADGLDRGADRRSPVYSRAG